MSASNRQAIQEIKSRLDILQLVSRYVELRQAGHRWVGVCPFHQESKPSLSVNPVQGFYYCFGCHAGGDSLDFYSRINGLEFGQALQELARETGVKLTAEGPQQREQKVQYEVCLQANACAQEYFRACLFSPEARQAQKYLQERGLSRNMLERFGLGWSTEGWQGLKDYLQKQGINPEQGVQAGLLSRNSRGRIYDRFRNRITFPIYDLQGRVLAFGGRLLQNSENQPKYLNSSESPVFKKGEQLYGLYQARKAVTQQKEVLLTEGYADVIALVQFGYENACGVLGTALTSNQVKRLGGLCSTVYLLFDGDRAGQQAALRSTEMLLAAGLQARVVTMPPEEDVDSLLRNQGVQALEQTLQSAREGLVFCLQMIKSSYDPHNIMVWARDFLSKLKDYGLQSYYLPRLAEGLQVSEPELRKSLQGKVSIASTQARVSETPSRPAAQRDRELLQFAVKYPDYLQELQRLGLEYGLQTQRGVDFWRKLIHYGHSRVYVHLDESEGKFFARCMNLQTEADQDSAAVWQDIQELLLRKKRRQQQIQLQNAMHEAQRAGDTAGLNDLLQEYSNLLREEE